MSRFLAVWLIVALGMMAPAAQADPALWKVTGKHNTLYLFGTIHLLPASEPLPRNISAAYADAEQLVMELDMDDLDPLATQSLMMSQGLLPEGEDLLAQLDAPTRSKLQDMAQRIGFDSRALSHFQPWLAAMTLEQLQYARQGLSATTGIEMSLTSKAIRDGKPIAGLETLTDQLSLFARLSQDEQLDYLRQTLDEMDEGPTQIKQLLDAWRSGDMAHLQTLLEQGMKDSPELMEQLTGARNRRWVQALQPLLEQQSDDYLVAVGALHMVGDQGLVHLLQQAGYVVTRQ